MRTIADDIILVTKYNVQYSYLRPMVTGELPIDVDVVEMSSASPVDAREVLAAFHPLARYPPSSNVTLISHKTNRGHQVACNNHFVSEPETFPTTELLARHTIDTQRVRQSGLQKR